MAQMVKNLPALLETPGSIPGSGTSPGEVNGNPLQYPCQENPWMEEPGRLHTVHGVTKSQTRLSNQNIRASQVVLVVKNLPANAGDMSLTSGSGKSPGGGHGNLLQYSYLENSMDRGA